MRLHSTHTHTPGETNLLGIGGHVVPGSGKQLGHLGKQRAVHVYTPFQFDKLNLDSLIEDMDCMQLTNSPKS